MKFKHRKWTSNDEKEKAILPIGLFPKGNWFYLFHMLIFILIVYPYLEAGAQKKPWLFTLMNSALIVTIVYTVSFNFKQFLGAVFLGGIELTFFLFPGLPESFLIANIATVFLYVYTVILILAYLNQSREIGVGEIYGSISVYILIGLIWAVLFQLIDYSYPGSFYMDRHGLDGALSWSDFLFFSFTTLTTLGYGDISPTSSPAQSLAIIEALTGVVFIAVVVSKSIGLYLVRFQNKL
ncbi:Uncharacterized protein AB751O23_BD_00040 [Chlamydiales bacterium SCGC AB-751-O23]|jgi:hypothetical protein|nr:Uncharacterized protein AB751O23_BD_00040 [Chlamydiales bacterium SCGC AB-751-O23]